MLKKKFIIFSLAAMLTISPMTVFATEDVTETMETTEAVEEDILIYSNVLTRSDVRTCQITVNADVPAHMANAYITIKNLESGYLYQAPLMAVNNYCDKFFVEPGNYSVVELQFYDDVNHKYPFNPVDDFTLEDNSNIAIDATLVDYEALENEIKGKLKIEDEEIEPSTVVEEEIEELKVLNSDYEVIHNGPGNVQMAITGNYNYESDVIVNITKEGALGTCEYIMSFDNGETFTSPECIPLSGYIKYKGLKFEFDGDYFYTDDYFTAFVPDPSKKLVYDAEGKENYLTVKTSENHKYAVDVLAENAIDLVFKAVKVDKENFIYDISLDNGITWLGEQLLSDDNTVYIADYDLYVTVERAYFSNDSTVTVTAPKVKEMNDIAVYTAGAILLAILVMIINRAKSYKTKDSAYTIKRYQSVKSKESE